MSCYKYIGILVTLKRTWTEQSSMLVPSSSSITFSNTKTQCTQVQDILEQALLPEERSLEKRYLLPHQAKTLIAIFASVKKRNRLCLIVKCFCVNRGHCCSGKFLSNCLVAILRELCHILLGMGLKAFVRPHLFHPHSQSSQLLPLSRFQQTNHLHSD